MQQPDPQVNPRKIFVGNLPWSVSEQQLSELFAPHGEIVEVRLVIDRMSGRSKGIGFVEYTTEEEAQKAIEAMNGAEIDGRALIVNIARPPRPREDRPQGGFGGGRGGFGGGRSGGFGGGGRSGGSRGGFGNGRSGSFNDRQRDF